MRWRYLVLSYAGLSGDTEWDRVRIAKGLDQVGRDGWELIHVSEPQETWIFKKPATEMDYPIA